MNQMPQFLFHSVEGTEGQSISDDIEGGGQNSQPVNNQGAGVIDLHF